MMVTSQQFLESFGNIASYGFVRPTFLIDTKVGFSVQKNYPKKIKFIPAVNNRGEDDSVVTIWAVYESSYESKTVTRIPIRFSVDLMSRYRTKTLDLDNSDPDCPTKFSQIRSEKSKQPIRLTFKGCFFYSLEINGLVDENNKPMTGTEILEEVYKHHCDSIKFSNAIRYWWQSFISEGPYKTYSFLIDSIEFLLKKVFQRSFINAPERSIYLNGYMANDMIKNEKYSVTIMKYKISLPVVFITTILLILLSATIEINQQSLLNKLLDNKLIGSMFALSILFVFEDLIPNSLFIAMNKIIALRKTEFNKLLKKSF